MCTGVFCDLRQEEEAVQFFRPTWVEVNLDAIAQNVRTFRQRYPHKRLMAVVKADAYGHGAIPVARTALEAGADWLGVACLDEAMQLRQAGIQAPVLVMGYTPLTDEALQLAASQQVSLTAYELEALRQLSRWSRGRQQQLRIHLKLDTGMGRLGLRQQEEIRQALEELRQSPGLVLEGVYTHFATADEADKTYAREQHRRFQEWTAWFAGIQPRPLLHCGNSAAGIELPEQVGDMLRLGISLYGIYPSREVDRSLVLQPAMRWKTRVVMLKSMHKGESVSYGATYRVQEEGERIATLPVGYADGYSRRLSNRGAVLIRGVRCPVVGRVCMDQTMVRIPPGLEVQVGDEVLLFGEGDGGALPTEEMAEWLDTIAYEIVCLVGKRVPRLYVHAGQGFSGRDALATPGDW